MHHDLQVRLIDSLLDLVSGGQTQLADSMTRMPVHAYTCTERLAIEREQLFGRLPLALGLSCELPAPGHYVTNDRAGVPVLMTRADDGRARAFLNVCRHRGARVARGPAGHARKVLSCPYHGWSYGLDGRLRHVPSPAAFDGLDRDCHGLTELPACERHGIVWVGLTPGAELELPGLPAELDGQLASFGLASMHHHEQRVIEQPFNWKIAVDTFLEPYHFGVLHSASIAPLFFHDLCLVDRYGPHLREIMPRRSIETLRELPREQWNLPQHSVLIYVLFPNTVWVVQIDHVELWRIYPHPDDPARCSMTMDFLVPEPVRTDSAREHWRRNLDLLMHTVLEEDFPTGVTIQQGCQSAAQSHVTFGRNEPALAAFETEVAERCGLAGELQRVPSGPAVSRTG